MTANAVKFESVFGFSAILGRGCHSGVRVWGFDLK